MNADPGNGEPPLLSVVMVAFNAAGVIGGTIEAVRELMPDAEIVVVDNGSTDDSVEVARRAAPDLVLVEGHGNVGFGGGVNRGAGVATGDLLLILNTDAPPTRIDREGIETLNALADVGLAACLVTEGGRTAFPVFRQHGWRWELTSLISRAFLIPRELPFRRRVVTPRKRTWVGGIAVLVRRSEFADLGGFDERFFLYSEDRDLSRTYATAGYPLRTSDAIATEHIRDEYAPSALAEQIAWSLLSMLEFVGKWEGRDTARAAATRALRMLKGIVWLGSLLGRLPGPGPRARSAAERADEVQRQVALVASGEKGGAAPYALVRSMTPELHLDASKGQGD